MPVKYYSIKKTSNVKKDTAWKYFAKYIRIRDALKTTGTDTHARCITCGKIELIENIDAGHAMPGRANSILFSEELCNAQCHSCNRFNGGEYQMYKRVLIERYGQRWWDYWEYMKSQHVEYTQFDYEQIARVYREKTRGLYETHIL
jgi:DNA-directed RNA polymerase subunit N (RpoN/RPB10)